LHLKGNNIFLFFGRDGPSLFVDQDLVFILGRLHEIYYLDVLTVIISIDFHLNVGIEMFVCGIAVSLKQISH
jgi:hypothetical protein